MTFTDRLAKGDTVLVTGATGFLGASVVDELVSKGFKVRGVIRSDAKAQPLKEKIEKLYGPGHLEFVKAPDAEKPGAFKSALEGASGFIHLAVDISASLEGPKVNTDAAVASSIDMTLGIFKSAAQVPSIKAAVVTSSCVSHYSPQFGIDGKYSVDDFNDGAAKMAYELPDDHPFKGILAYVASKTRAEQELWAWVQETKPSFSVNSVLPHIVLGKPFNPAEGIYSTSTWLAWLFQSKLENNPIVGFFSPPFWIVDVKDVATMHIAALIASDVNHQRLWAAGVPPTSINDVLAIWREAYPNHKLVADFDLPAPPKQELDRTKETALLERYSGHSWLPLKQTLLDTVAGVA